MTGIIVFAVIIAVVLATSLIKAGFMPDKVKNLIATVLSVIGAAVVELTTHGFDFGSYVIGDWFGTVLTVYGGAQLIYNFILKGTSVESKLEDVEVFPPPNDGV